MIFVSTGIDQRFDIFTRHDQGFGDELFDLCIKNVFQAFLPGGDFGVARSFGGNRCEGNRCRINDESSLLNRGKPREMETTL